MDYKKIIIQWLEFEIPVVKRRNHDISLTGNFIISLTGPRRSGKTYLCFQMINDLKKSKVPASNLLYVNFEDEKMINANAGDLDSLYETLLELSPPDKKHPLYFFFDEIQNVSNWEVWVRRIHETNQNIKFILTGSSSALLSSEFSTKLTGRTLSFEIFPLSFKELLLWKNLAYDIKTISGSRKKAEVKNMFDSYLNSGGFPAIQHEQVSFRDEILQQYYHAILMRDVIDRHQVNNTKKLKTIAHFLLEATAGDLSYTKITNKLNSLGYKTSKTTVIEYLSYLEEAYLFFQTLKFEYSTTKQLGSIKKVYCIDNGLVNAASFKFSDDRGKLLENVVFLELRRKSKNIFYNRNGAECDFLVMTKNKITDVYQVTYELSEDNRHRELKGLLDAMGKFNLKKGTVLTSEQEETITKDGYKIFVLPVWKWLLL